MRHSSPGLHTQPLKSVHLHIWLILFTCSLPQPSSSFVSLVLVSTEVFALDRLEELQRDHYKVVDHLLADLDNLFIHLQCSSKSMREAGWPSGLGRWI